MPNPDHRGGRTPNSLFPFSNSELNFNLSPFSAFEIVHDIKNAEKFDECKVKYFSLWRPLLVLDPACSCLSPLSASLATVPLSWLEWSMPRLILMLLQASGNHLPNPRIGIFVGCFLIMKISPYNADSWIGQPTLIKDFVDWTCPKLLILLVAHVFLAPANISKAI